MHLTSSAREAQPHRFLGQRVINCEWWWAKVCHNEHALFVAVMDKKSIDLRSRWRERHVTWVLCWLVAIVVSLSCHCCHYCWLVMYLPTHCVPHHVVLVVVYCKKKRFSWNENENVKKNEHDRNLADWLPQCMSTYHLQVADSSYLLTCRDCVAAAASGSRVGSNGRWPYWDRNV